MTDSKIPVTVLTGFLGSGKTTLVNHILSGSHGKKIAIIENEYGEIGIDDGLVLETKEELYEMNNGCVCCTVRGDLIRILGRLLKRKSKLDAIMIETTGLADPAPVAQTFFVDDDLKESLRLDAIITVVDAKHVIPHLDEEKPDGIVNEAIQQIAFADKILLNKTDLVSDSEKDTVLQRIHEINRGARVIECTHAAVPLELILEQHAFDLDKILGSDPDFLKEEKEDHEHEHHGKIDDCHQCKSGDVNHKHKHKHDSRVGSVGIEIKGSLDMPKFNKWLSTLLQEKGADIYRSKGILAIHGSNDRFVFHGVHMMLQFGSSREGLGRPWNEGEERICRAVFIGKELRKEELVDGFKSCLVE